MKKRANTRFSLTAKGDAMRPAIIVNVESLPSRMAGDRTRILCQSHLSHRELQGGHLLREEASKYSLLTDSKGRRNAPRRHHQRLRCRNCFLPGRPEIELGCCVRVIFRIESCKEDSSCVKKRANTRFSLKAKGDAMRPAVIINVTAGKRVFSPHMTIGHRQGKCI